MTLTWEGDLTHDPGKKQVATKTQLDAVPLRDLGWFVPNIGFVGFFSNFFFSFLGFFFVAPRPRPWFRRINLGEGRTRQSRGRKAPYPFPCLQRPKLTGHANF